MKITKITSVILLIITILASFMPIFTSEVKATNYSVDYFGPISYNGTTVGKFNVNGSLAFCMDHKKTSPATGTTVTEEIYNNDNILKVLYYGWGGNEPYAFSSEAQGIVFTTLALDHIKNGNSYGMIQQFLDYVNSKPIPQITLNFSDNNLNAYFVSNNLQRTQTINVSGSSNYYLTIQLQNGVTLVNETKNTRRTGTVNVYGGDSFHLEAPLSVNGKWTSNSINNHKYKFQPIVYKSSNTTLQDLAGRYKVVSDPSSSINLNVEWLKTGELEIYKKDEKTRKAIANTKFEVRNSNNEVVATATTNTNGYAKVSNLIAGRYTLTEISANNNYILNNTPYQIEIAVGETKTIDITNEHKKGSLRIVKVDNRDHRIPIPNVTFEIWNVELNEKVATKTTGEDGTITINNLRTGQYKVREISTNEWYELNTEDKTTTVEYNTTNTLTIENKIKVGYIEIIKQDAEYPDIKLEGVKFIITNEAGEVVDTLTTNKDGYAKSKPLAIDKEYFVKEIETIYKYILSSEIKNVTFVPADANKSKMLTFGNEHKKGNIKVIKVDKDNNKIGLGNVEFDLWSKEFNKVIGTYKTDVNGEITIENLRIGEYKLLEKNTNKWYNLADDTETIVVYNETTDTKIENELKKGSIKVIKVDKDNNELRIPNVKFEVLDSKNNVLETIETNENGEAVTDRYPIRDYETIKLREIETAQWYVLNDEVKEIELQANQIKDFVFENEKKKGQIKVIKVDADNKEIKLKNVEFEVLDEQENIVDTIITDDNGEAITKRLPIDQQYTIRETKTLEEYLLSAETQTVILEQDQIKDVTFENEHKKGQIEVYKVDKENTEVKIEGVEFQIINSNNEIVETITTNVDGYAITSKLPTGEYKIKETKSNYMYVLNDEIIKINVFPEEISRVDITNERIKGKIKIIKTSADDNFINGVKAGTPLENVKFEIYDSNNNKVDEIVTNSEGIAITKELDRGEYIIKEVESAEWYLLNENNFATKIDKNNEIVEINITNESEKPDIDIEKDGILQTTANQEIKYDFNIKNTGNTKLEHFTWTDILPTDYVIATRLITGTYNQDLNYSIYYKTNKNDYRLLKDNLNTKVNNYISFTDVHLEKDEFITEFKANFGTVDIGFKSVETPQLFVKVKGTVKNEDIFTNKTRIEGYNKTYLVWDEDFHTTKIYEKEINVKKLPRTGC